MYRISMPLVGIPFLFTTFASPAARASIINAENVLVSILNEIHEYTPSGAIVQSIAVPWPAGQRPTSESTRDLCMMQDGRIAVFNGTFTPFVSLYQPTDNSWQHMTFSGWSTGNSGRFGGIASIGPYVFVSDASTSGGEARGVVRFDSRDASAIRFETSVGTNDVNLGLDGLLYALGDGNESTSAIKVFDPVSLALHRTITLSSSSSPNGFAVNAIGNLFVSSNGGVIREYSPTGNLVRSVTTGTTSVRDIDLAPDGRIFGGTFINGVLLTSEELASFSGFPTYIDPYVSFGFHVPEPASLALLFSGTLIVLLRGARRKQI